MIRLLALLCCLFLAVIAGEVLIPAESPAGTIAAAPRPVNPAATSATPSNAARAQWVAEILARPLFSPSRRPAPGAAVSSNEASLPRLAGVIGTPDGAVAIFQPEGDAKPVLAHGGDHVGAWQVTRIGSSAVYLERGADRITLNPRFSTASPLAPNPIVPPPPLAPLRR